MADKTAIIARDTLHKGFGLFERIVFRRKRRDGDVVELTREILDTGDGAAILPYDKARGTIILIRQFRGVAFLQEGRESIVEVCAGKLEGADPLTRIRKETEEETGIRLTSEPRDPRLSAAPAPSRASRATWWLQSWWPRPARAAEPCTHRPVTTALAARARGGFPVRRRSGFDWQVGPSSTPSSRGE